MADPFAKTGYRVAQHWRFRNDTPEVSDTLIVTAVEDHPTQGIICAVVIEYDPPFRSTPKSYMRENDYWFTEAALDSSVTELVADKGFFPNHHRSTGEFQCDADSWQQNHRLIVQAKTVGEVIRETYVRHVRQRDEDAKRPPYTPPPDESLGLWSLIAGDKAERFRELLEQHPTLANDPLPRDDSDDYCFSGDEYEEYYPLMLAAQVSAVGVAKVLLAFGADVCMRNQRGETALHFSGKARYSGCAADEVARMLCERGANPNALNIDGKSPLTCYYSMTEVAAVLVEFGAVLNLNHALRLGKLEWVRQQLRDNPNVMAESATPNCVIDDVVHMMRSVAKDRLGMWNHNELSGWHLAAEIEEQVFEEYKDILEAVVAHGVDPIAGSGLFNAVQNFDTSLAAWLLEHSVDPIRDLKRQATYITDIARSRRMVNLLKKYGAIENPYPRKLDQWEEQTQRLKDQFV